MEDPRQPPSPRADGKLTPLLESNQELADEMWRFRHPEKGGKKVTFEKILVWLRNEWDITISISGLHAAYRWLALHRRWQESEAFAQQARSELAKDPKFTDEELDRFAERVLKVEASSRGDVKAYVGIARLQLDRKKSQASGQDLIEIGLKAIMDEIKGNPEAMEHFRAMEAAIRRAKEEG